MKYICNIAPYTSDTLVVDARNNQIMLLERTCFTNTELLKVIKLNNNKLQIITSDSFSNLLYLILLDLSNNYIFKISAKQVPINSRIHFLILHNVAVKVFNINSFKVNKLVTNEYHVCCAFKNLICLSSKPWYMTCERLLPGNTIRFIYYKVLILIIFLNGISLCNFLKVVTAKDKVKSVYIHTAISINIADITCGAFIANLLSADYFYQETFGALQIEWQQSPMCFLSSAVAQNYSLLSPCLLSFVAFQRFMIVLYPLNNRYKSRHFVFKVNLGIWLLSILFSMIINVITYIHFQKVPNTACFPFFNPTRTMLLTKISTIFISITQSFALSFILMLYIFIVLKVKKSKESIKNFVGKIHFNKSLIINVVVLIVPYTLCWLSSSLTYLSSVFLHRYPVSLIQWHIITIFPINSIVNSVIFIATSK